MENAIYLLGLVIVVVSGFLYWLKQPLKLKNQHHTTRVFSPDSDAENQRFEIHFTRKK